MFEGLKKHRTIFVTGPNRSGTTIAARIIAADTGHSLVLEDEFECSNRTQFAAFLHAEYGPAVIQCPFFAHEIHDLGYLYGIDMNDCLVVFMHRYRPDIIASEQRAKKRVDFDFIARGQRQVYNAEVSGPFHMSDLKYNAWEDQCKVIPNALDVGYESLSAHELWDSNHTLLEFEHDTKVLPPPEHMRDALRAIQDR